MSMDRRNSFLMTALVVVAAAWAALAYAQQPKVFLWQAVRDS